MTDMKKVVFALIATMLVGVGSISAQNKFKSFKTSGAKTETKSTQTPATTTNKVQATEKAKVESKTTNNKFQTAIKAQPQAIKATSEAKAATATAKSATAKTATTKAASAKATPKKSAVAVKSLAMETFNGFWANSYSDGIGGMVTDHLSLTLDTINGTATGEYKDENGDGRKVSGHIQGNQLVMKYDADGDEFATIRLIDANTIKLEGFTGTFKRVPDMTSSPEAELSDANEQTPVDPAFQDVKKYLENK